MSLMDNSVTNPVMCEFIVPLVRVTGAKNFFQVTVQNVFGYRYHLKMLLHFIGSPNYSLNFNVHIIFYFSYI